jgi:uncharacterized SAM-binding protein YcdF (DUF218 family)
MSTSRHRISEPEDSFRSGKWLMRVLATIGLLTVLVIVTPIDSWWVSAYRGPVDPPQGDVLILISAANDDTGLISFSSYWRARYALYAWQTGGFKTMVISGGGGHGIRDFLVLEGVPSGAIVAEWQSTSTRENGINTARLVRGMPGKKVLLTSDFHMLRALRVFRKLGVDVTPSPVPDVAKQAEHLNARFSAFETLSLETVKIVYYRLRGWI